MFVLTEHHVHEMNVITTNRLLLRPFVLEDAPFILKLLNEPGFIRNIADRGVRELNGARDYMQTAILSSYECHGFGMCCVCLSADGRPIGMAGLLKREYLDDIDLGYALLAEFQGTGYALEATSAVMDYTRGVLNLKRIVAIVNEDNGASIRLLGKLGFRRNGMIRIPGGDKDVALFQNWTTQKAAT